MHNFNQKIYSFYQWYILQIKIKDFLTEILSGYIGNDKKNSKIVIF